MLVQSGAVYGTDNFTDQGCGMGAEATLYLTERGVKVVGTDAWSWDAPFSYTAERFAAHIADPRQAVLTCERGPYLLGYLRLDFAAASDSAIVSGLVFLALRVYSGRSAAEILATTPDYVAAIGLARHLSPTRSNGMAALLAFIQDTARAQQGQ